MGKSHQDRAMQVQTNVFAHLCNKPKYLIPRRMALFGVGPTLPGLGEIDGKPGITALIQRQRSPQGEYGTVRWEHLFKSKQILLVAPVTM